jgi:hypothetical protein
MSCNAGAFARRDLILSDRIRNIPFITRHSPEGYIVSKLVGDDLCGEVECIADLMHVVAQLMDERVFASWASE